LIRLRVARVVVRRRYPKLLLAGLLFSVGSAAILYGVFALVYAGDGASRTYVTLAGHRFDARLAGVTSVALGVSLAVCGRVATSARRRGRGIRVWTDPPTRR
jgi:hypothetical protein